MQIKSVILENFRGYRDRQTINISDFTAFVGKNDVGKSTVLEALDIFFNEGNGVVKIDPNDVNFEAKQIASGSNVDIVIGVEFTNLPNEVVLDENSTTTLTDEYLLSATNTLTIIKRYPNGGNKEKVFIYANHPSHDACRDLLSKKQAELRKLTQDMDCNRNSNVSMRAAIWASHQQELNLQMQEIDVAKEDAKNIWEKLKGYMPIYCLFQSDRSNEDKDKEVQDPLKEAVRIIFSKPEIKNKCQEIYDAVMGELNDVATRTLQKVNQMNENLANSLHPKMPSPDGLKWNDIFKSVSITGDNDIPINKRGSGVKRLILLNFFRAEAERTQQNRRSPGIIYAIEEPETAQHIEHQLLLIKALKELAATQNTQVIITTHSSNILKELAFSEIRLVKDTQAGKVVESVQQSQLPYPSLNEIAFTSFGETSSEYHNELYGHIEFNGWLQQYKNGKTTFPYNKVQRSGSIQQISLIKSEIIRHQIHHPENHQNIRFTPEELLQSISDMRQFIAWKNANP